MTIVITPTFPISAGEFTLALDDATGNSVVFENTSVPDDSSLTLGVLTIDLDRTVSTGVRVQGALDDEAGLDVFTGDRPGAYAFRAYEYTQSPGSPAFPGDPAGERVQDFVTEQSTVVYVGALMDLPFVTADGDGADLRIQVNNLTVRSASLQNFRSNNAESASEQTAVVAALAALVGTTVTAIGGDLDTLTNVLRAAYVAHIADTTPHVNPDSINDISISAATKETGAIDLLNELKLKYVRHARDSTSASSNWHRTDVDDLENLPLAADAVDIASATVLYADLAYRGYAKHLDAFNPTTEPLVHDAQDVTNTIGAATPLDAVIRDFFDALVDTSQTAERGENPGDIIATTDYGFIRADTT